MDFPLGIGLGPIGALPDRFHIPRTERERLLTAYGYDLTAWPEWAVLRDITELHSLPSYLRLAPGKPLPQTS